ncbi:DoxX family protein [Priestia abyssalis]|uniref:DoxX family protein n=1 Tax=Priestia abyssalis TaxID=1221450 RepID=UPI0009949B68|nr:DoxX family protein [Priestia abyssalis]
MNMKYEGSSLLLRLILGITFFLHGLSKFQGGINNAAGWFDSIGIPGFLAYVVAIIELAGGIAMILGLGTRIVAVLFAIVMLGAIFTVKLSAGFMGNGQAAGYELDLVLLAVSIYFAVNGSRLWSFDSVLRKKTEDEKYING